MANVIKGTFTLSQMLDLTYHSKYKTRFDYKKRDVIKKVIKIKETTLHPDRLNEPTVTYIFQTKSYPQYGKYTNYTTYKRQRKFHHEYDNILSIEADKDGKFSMNSTNWRYRLGSQKKWNNKPPQAKVKTIYRTTMQLWKNDYTKKVDIIKKRNIKKEEKTILLKKEKDIFNKKILRHRRDAPYLDVGDFNAKTNAVNGDFYFRVAPVLQFYGHLYGRNIGNVDNPDIKNPFLPKHAISLIEVLIKLKILV